MAAPGDSPTTAELKEGEGMSDDLYDDPDAAAVPDDDNYPKDFDPELIERVRGISGEELDRIDVEIVQRGMTMFFSNDFGGCEDLFNKHYLTDPLIANSYGTVGTIRACLSFEQGDIDEAIKRLLFSNRFAAKLIPTKSTVGKMVTSVTNWWYKQPKQKDLLSRAEFRAHVVQGESEMLRAILLLLQDSYTAYFKAGLALRRGYNVYDKLQKHVEKYPDEHLADANSIGGMHFGLGCIHVVTSILPPRILAILSMLGYMHDRKKGFEHLKICLDSRSLRSPVASLFLLAFHGMLPSFATLITEKNIPLAEEVIEKTLQMFPKSVIHLWLSGRVERLRRGPSVAKSISTFRSCVANSATLQSTLPQLKHFAMYDEAWSHCALLEWEEAIECFQVLEKESKWSRMFYAYTQGCCWEMLGDAEKAKTCYWRSDTYESYKLAGKVISVEQFVRRRLRLLEQADYLYPGYPHSIPGIEMMMHFNIIPQTPLELLDRILPLVIAARDALKGDKENVAIVKLIQANILREQWWLRKHLPGGEAPEVDMLRIEAGTLYTTLREEAKELTEETWIEPYCLYEMAVLRFREGDDKTSQKLIGKVKSSFGDYNFEMTMGFRCHLTNDVFRQQLKEQKEAEKAEKAEKKKAGKGSQSPGAASPSSPSDS